MNTDPNTPERKVRPPPDYEELPTHSFTDSFVSFFFGPMVALIFAVLIFFGGYIGVIIGCLISPILFFSLPLGAILTYLINDNTVLTPTM